MAFYSSKYVADNGAQPPQRTLCSQYNQRNSVRSVASVHEDTSSNEPAMRSSSDSD